MSWSERFATLYGFLRSHPLALGGLAALVVGIMIIARVRAAAHEWLRTHSPRAEAGSHSESLPAPIVAAGLLIPGLPTRTPDDALRRYALVARLRGEPAPLLRQHRIGQLICVAGGIALFVSLARG
ncbi:MAG TPA: hypothetical protein VMV18_10750 [bacterium]|nr:hypothetical protein [bacterium]